MESAAKLRDTHEGSGLHRESDPVLLRCGGDYL